MKYIRIILSGYLSGDLEYYIREILDGITDGKFDIHINSTSKFLFSFIII